MFERATSAVLALGLAALAGCESNPSLAPEEGEHDDELTVSLTITPDHIHILQTEVVFGVSVLDHHGDPVTDFDSIQVERRTVGEDAWRGVELSRVGAGYEGTYMFSSSGDYELRVTGRRAGETAMAILYEHPDPLHCARAHAEAGGYRVEFESFPGHIHEGDAGTLRFWVMEPESDPATGVRPPVTGLTPELHVQQGDGSGGLYAAAEAETGVYEGEYTFAVPDETHVGLHFTGMDGRPAEAEFHLHVSHGH